MANIILCFQRIRPILIISRGVNIAPFISLLYEVESQHLQVRTTIFHCLGPKETAEKFILQKTISKLKNLDLIESIHLFEHSQLVQVLKENQELIWEFVNNRKCNTYVAGCNGAVLTDVMKFFSEMIQSHCTPLVYRGDSDYSNAFIDQLKRVDRFEELWF